MSAPSVEPTFCLSCVLGARLLYCSHFKYVALYILHNMYWAIMFFFEVGGPVHLRKMYWATSSFVNYSSEFLDDPLALDVAFSLICYVSHLHCEAILIVS